MSTGAVTLHTWPTGAVQYKLPVTFGNKCCYLRNYEIPYLAERKVRNFALKVRKMRGALKVR